MDMAIKTLIFSILTRFLIPSPTNPTLHLIFRVPYDLLPVQGKSPSGAIRDTRTMQYIRTAGNSFEIRNDKEPSWETERVHTKWPWRHMRAPVDGVYDHYAVSPADRHEAAKRAARIYGKRHGWTFKFELDSKDPSRLLVFRMA